ncbi:MAG TPA: F0F1 ATP synthase subunit B [Pyrinomonadaceae bacterium]|nr:F0F1 ATP synthase subunit B [Pyrinomonadaceae bacterium]
MALASEGGLPPWVDTVARVVNLLLFLGVMVYLLRGPISAALKTRKENIRRDLMRAQEERNAALAKLEEVEQRLALLDSETQTIRAQAEREAADERERISRSTEDEARRLREQARREIESASKTARSELRRYAAEQSVRLAEEMIRGQMRPEDDARLVGEYIEELGGARR